jgi:hypothetical protein
MEAQAENLEENGAVTDASGILGGEIRSLRSLIRRVETQAKEDQTLASLLNVLEMHSRACTRLAALLKAERSLGTGDELHEALMEALQRVRRELGLEQRK